MVRIDKTELAERESLQGRFYAESNITSGTVRGGRSGCCDHFAPPLTNLAADRLVRVAPVRAIGGFRGVTLPPPSPDAEAQPQCRQEESGGLGHEFTIHLNFTKKHPFITVTGIIIK